CVTGRVAPGNFANLPGIDPDFGKGLNDLITAAIFANCAQHSDITPQQPQVNRDVASDATWFVMQGPYSVGRRRHECFRALQGSVKMGCTKAKDIAGRVDQDDALFLIRVVEDNWRKVISRAANSRQAKQEGRRTGSSCAALWSNRLVRAYFIMM